MDSIRDNKKRCHLAQLRNAVSNFSNPRIINKILATGVDVNHKFQNNSFESDFTTALHIAATKTSVTNFNILLDHGADVTIQDSEGFTALHRIVRDCLSDNTYEPPNNPFISPVLLAHVKSNNFVNPSDNRGFTHFHVACIINDADAVAFFLDNGVSVDHAVSQHSDLFPGYTPLHFASRFASLRTAEILASRGANVQLKDARAMSPVDVLLERKIAMLELLEVKEELDDVESVEAILEKIHDNETILKFFVESEVDIGMPKNHAICTLQKSAVVAKLLENLGDVDAQISRDSAIWPGYTMLHFAAHCNVNTMLLLLEQGANIRAEEASGLTPFDICIKWCDVRDVHCIVSRLSSWQDIRFSDGKTKLLECIAAMASLDRFKAFLQDIGDANACLPTDSALWPGSSLLHLSVMFGERCAAKEPPCKRPRAFNARIVKACLAAGASIASRDVRGRTAVHLAFRLGASRLVEMLLRHCHDNASDDENLSLLHIACAIRNKWPAEEWSASDGVDVNLVYRGGAALPNVEPGWTALHVAVSSNADPSVAKRLLDQGADPYRPDRSNMTPIHHLLLASQPIEPNLGELLLSLPDLAESSVEAAFTHLHVASYFDNARAVERLVNAGACIDARSSLARFDDCTPLQLAVINRSMAALQVLVRRGADVFIATRRNRSTPLSMALSMSNNQGKCLNCFVAAVKSNQRLRRRLQMELGLTLLHVVCRAGHVDAIRDLLRRGAEVNARMRDDSTFWPGWTALHVLVATGIESVHQKRQLKDFKAMLEMLLGHGADVTIANADGDTPLHLMLKKYPCDTGYFIMTSLLSQQKDFSRNPANKDGLTHFHAACLANNLEAVEKFLSCDVDVNQPIDYFADHYGGSTPLHLALNSNSKRYFGIGNQLLVLDLLLQHHADLQAQDDHAYTPFHVAADCDPSCVNLLQKLIDNGADINARTLDGKTAFEMLLWSKEISVEVIEFFVKQNYQINGCNPMTDRGYLSIILNEKNIKLRAEILKALMDAASIVASDEMGRTAIHNIVATDDLVILEHNYVELIEKLTKLGCDVNEQDDSGMTALHLALIFRNKEATTALLICGADINIVDSRSKTAFSYALDPCTRCFTRCNSAHDYLLKVLVEHVHKLQLFGLYVSELNDKMKALALENRWIKNLDLLANTKSNADTDKSREIDSIVIGPRTWTLRHFLMEHGPVDEYRTLNLEERNVVDEFFQTIDYHGFRYLRYMLKIQYRQAVARGALIKPAIVAIQKLTGLPCLCAELVVCHLRNPDLKNVITALACDH